MTDETTNAIETALAEIASLAPDVSKNHADDDNAEWHATQYQVADARHDPREAAVLVYMHLGRETWDDGDFEGDDEKAHIRAHVIDSVEREED